MCLTWAPEDEREFDQYVQCTKCDRWLHFVCAMYPAPEQFPRSWKLENERFVCKGCEGGKVKCSARLRELQEARASQLPRCSMAAAVEEFVGKELKEAGVTLPKPVVVRVVSRKRYMLPTGTPP